MLSQTFLLAIRFRRSPIRQGRGRLSASIAHARMTISNVMRKAFTLILAIFAASCLAQEPTVPIKRILPEDIEQHSIQLVRFSTNSFAGHLRHAKFKRLRDDENVSDVSAYPGSVWRIDRRNPVS